MKSNFVIVYHKWWMNSKGWEQEFLENTTKEKAKEHAEAKCFRESHQFLNIDFYVIQANGTSPSLPRRLTWKERITGRIF